jgi:catechol 2,3-dioxygenase-like lactoylglutathione lyase family enzyme
MDHATKHGQFRFAYFTRQYEATVAFYKDGLELPVVEMWDRSVNDRGAIFGAAAGMIEVLVRPQSGHPDHFFDEREPQGAFMVIEVDQVDARYQRIKERGLTVHQELSDQAWGHRSFCVRDPNGLTIYLYSETEINTK